MSSDLTNSFRGVILDLDGTLIESAGEIAAAMDRTLEELGLPPLGQTRVEALIGRGVRVLVERALREVEGGAQVDVDATVERFEATAEIRLGRGPVPSGEDEALAAGEVIAQIRPQVEYPEN